MIALLFAALLAAPVPLSLGEGSKLVIEGDSSLHAWKCEATKLEGTGAAASIEAVAGSVSAFKIGVPVRELRCGNDSMDAKLRDALRADKFARIDFTFVSSLLLPGAANDTHKLKLTGKLAVAGVEKNVTAVVTVASAPGNSWIASGAVPLEMSKFGIEPPSAMLGLMKTADRITVRFALKVLTEDAASTHARN